MAAVEADEVIMAAAGYERRVGSRHSVAWLEVGWRYWIGPPEEGGSRPVGTATGHLVDVSVTGAGVMAPASPYVGVGVAVALDFAGLHGGVVIRRVDAVNGEASARLYGVEFLDVHSELGVALGDAFVARHSELPEWRDPRYQTGALLTDRFGAGTASPLDARSLGDHRR